MTSEAPRELWMLAEVIEKTAANHREVAKIMRDGGWELLADKLDGLGTRMEETVKQIRAGRYGPPGGTP